MRPNGNILFSTLSNANLYELDPSTSPAQAQIVTTFPGATALTGFAKIGDDKYAVIGGIRGTYQYENETIYTIDLAANGTTGVAALLPDSIMLNGAASLPENESILLLADARVACIWRVDTSTGSAEKILEGEFLAAPANATVPIGVNGLKVRAGYVYFTNTGTGVFGRVAIDGEGYPLADAIVPEVIATAADPTSASWDDFTVLSDDGSALACISPDGVVAISPTGTVVQYIGEGETDGWMLGPSSITINESAQGNFSAYVTTKGSSTAGLGGQIFKLSS